MTFAPPGFVLRLCALAAAMLVPLGVLAPSRAVAGHRSHRGWVRSASLPVAPTPDAVQLDILAPPTGEATALQTYGDAEYARARSRRLFRERVRIGEVPEPAVAPTCDPQFAGDDSCDRDPRDRRYMLGYAFTPADLSAPQHVAVPPGSHSQILPPFTALSWAVDSLRLDPHN